MSKLHGLAAAMALALGFGAGEASAFVAQPLALDAVPVMVMPAAMCGRTCQSGGRYIPGPPSVCDENGLLYCGSSRGGPGARRVRAGNGRRDRRRSGWSRRVCGAGKQLPHDHGRARRRQRQAGPALRLIGNSLPVARVDLRAEWLFFKSPSRSKFLFAHDLVRKPLHTFRDHALDGKKAVPRQPPTGGGRAGVRQVSKHPSPRADQLRAMREAQFARFEQQQKEAEKSAAKPAAPVKSATPAGRNRAAGCAGQARGKEEGKAIRAGENQDQEGDEEKRTLSHGLRHDPRGPGLRAAG